MTKFLIIYAVGYLIAFIILMRIRRTEQDKPIRNYDLLALAFASLLSWIAVFAIAWIVIIKRLLKRKRCDSSTKLSDNTMKS